MQLQSSAVVFLETGIVYRYNYMTTGATMLPESDVSERMEFFKELRNKILKHILKKILFILYDAMAFDSNLKKNPDIFSHRYKHKTLTIALPISVTLFLYDNFHINYITYIYIFIDQKYFIIWSSTEFMTHLRQQQNLKSTDTY